MSPESPHSSNPGALPAHVFRALIEAAPMTTFINTASNGLEAVYDESGQPVHYQGFLLEIGEQRRREIVHEGERRVLELIARGAPLEQTLLELAGVIDEASEGVLASVRC